MRGRIYTFSATTGIGLLMLRGGVIAKSNSEIAGFISFLICVAFLTAFFMPVQKRDIKRNEPKYVKKNEWKRRKAA